MRDTILNAYRFPATRPELPEVESWLPFVREAYADNWFTNFGKLSRRLEGDFERKWSRDDGCCVLSSSGTAALAGALIARGVRGPVIVPAFTFPATWSSAQMAGCVPVLADVDPETWRLSPRGLKEAFSYSGAKAAILVCPYGLLTDYSEHIAVTQEFGAELIIDNAAGLGTNRSWPERYENVHEVYSLHATKPFGVGEGGAVFTHGRNADAVRRAFNFGLPNDGRAIPHWGINGKISEMHAAVGLAALTTFDGRIAMRRERSASYIRLLSRFDELCFPQSSDLSAWQVFPVLMPTERAVERAIELGAQNSVEIRRYYRPALSALDVSLTPQMFPVAEDLSSRMICLPVYSYVGDDEWEELLSIVSVVLENALEGARGL